jgi:hypothetical protein
MFKSMEQNSTRKNHDCLERGKQGGGAGGGNEDNYTGCAIPGTIMRGTRFHEPTLRDKYHHVCSRGEASAVRSSPHHTASIFYIFQETPEGCEYVHRIR